MKVLTVTKSTFLEMLSDIIKTGVTFEAIEDGGMITITFTGGY